LADTLVGQTKLDWSISGKAADYLQHFSRIRCCHSLYTLISQLSTVVVTLFIKLKPPAH